MKVFAVFVICFFPFVNLISAPVLQIEAVSVSHSTFSGSKFANGFSGDAQISADGRWVVFVSQATDLVTNDRPSSVLTSHPDIFVKNLQSGQTTLVSVTPDGANSGNNASSWALISDDGRYVAFESEASDLVSGDRNGLSDLFLRDVASNQTTLVSINKDGAGSGDQRSYLIMMSPNGRFLLFESYASDLVANDTNQLADYFLRDRQTGVTRLISAETITGTSTNLIEPALASLSADGRFVAFTSSGPAIRPELSGVSTEIYLSDLSSGTTTWISSNAVSFTGLLMGNFKVAPVSYGPLVNPDGRFVVFKSSLSNEFLFRYEVATATLRLVESNLVDNLGGGFANSPGLQISDDGRFILYESLTHDGLQSQIYLWDAQSNASRLVSVANDGISPANGYSTSASMTSNTRYVVFSSDAPDLVSNSFPTNEPVFPRHIYLRDLVTGTTRSVNRGDGTRLEAVNPDLSADGQVITFDSYDSTLLPGDHNSAQDVFAHHLLTGTTSLVSERESSRGRTTGNGLSSILPNSASSNGQFIVFASEASNLVPNDTNGVIDVFVRDVLQKTTVQVSAIKSGNEDVPGNDASYNPVISSNGRFVAFSSRASNLVSNDFNDKNDVFVRDLPTGAIQLVSVGASGQSAGATIESPSISADGRFVLFQSSGSNLVALPEFPGERQVYVRDLQTGSNMLASVSPAGNPARSSASLPPVISPNGKLVLFSPDSGSVLLRDLAAQTTTAVAVPGAVRTASFSFSGDGNWIVLRGMPNLIIGGVVRYSTYLYEVASGQNQLLCADCESPFSNYDGTFFTYLQLASAQTGVRTVWIYDRKQDLRYPASMNLAGTGLANGHSADPELSSDGRFLVFESRATDIVANDTNGFTDVFVRDLLTGATLLLSRSKDHDGPGRSLSVNPVIAADGRTIFFESFSDDLVAGDENQNKDIFVAQVPVGDSDADGLADFWERAFFGDLSHNGQNDSDGDGQSDFLELQAGTNPAERASALKWTAVNLAGSDLTLSWNAVPGRAYRLQSKNNLNEAAWTDLPGVARADGFSASTKATIGLTGQRFYRVLLSP